MGTTPLEPLIARLTDLTAEASAIIAVEIQAMVDELRSGGLDSPEPG